jgi:putative spermidine/putrescine transport system permease protein
MTATSQRILFWTIVWFCILILSVPTIIVVGASFTTSSMISFPPEGFTFKWYEKIALGHDDPSSRRSGAR